MFELRRERRKVFIGVFHYISHQAGIGGKILIRLQLIILGNKLIHTIQAVEDEMRIHLTAQRLEGYLFILPSDGIPGFDDKHEKNKDQDNRADQYIVEGGIEYVLVSAHLGARVAQKGQPALASHADWQGKVYKIRGNTPEYPNLLEWTGYDVDPNTGQGTVKNPLGLHGYNCRHSHKPWDPRLRNPYVDENGNLKIDSEENKKRYELQQKQRAMERNLRAWKRKLIEKQEQINNPREDMDVSKLQQDYDRMAYQLTQKNKAYNDFCKQNDLQPQYDRIKVADFGREQTKRSNAGAKRYKKSMNRI